MQRRARVESELKLTLAVELVGQGLCSLHCAGVMESEHSSVDAWVGNNKSCEIEAYKRSVRYMHRNIYRYNN